MISPKKMKWIKHFILYIYLLILSAFALYVVYRRIISPAKEPVILWDLSYTQIFVYGIVALISGYMLFSTIYWDVLKKEKKKSVFSFIYVWHEELYKEILIIVNQHIKKQLEKWKFIRIIIGKYLRFLNTNISYLFAFVQIIPKITVIFCFYIDVFIFQTFHYFFFSLTLLLLVLLSDYIAYIIEQVYNLCVETASPDIEISLKKDKTTFVLNKISEKQNEIVMVLPPLLSVEQYIDLILKEKYSQKDFDIYLSLHFYENADQPLSIDAQATLLSYQYFLNDIKDLRKLLTSFKELKEVYFFLKYLFLIFYFIGWLYILFLNY